MIKSNTGKSLALVAAMMAAQGTLAAEAPAAYAADADLLESAFASAPLNTVEQLDLAAMEDTRGELWPLILGIVGVDVALATYFWGSYVPTVTAASPGGLCPNCPSTTGKLF